MHPWLNWIERLATDQKVAGSSPAGCTSLRLLRGTDKSTLAKIRIVLASISMHH